MSVENKVLIAYKHPDIELCQRLVSVLSELGFDPQLAIAGAPSWLPKETTNLPSLEGFCAAVLPLTENYGLDGLSGEEYGELIDHGTKNLDFAIIPLLFEDAGPLRSAKSELRYHRCKTELDAVVHLLRELPLVVGPLRKRS